LTIILGIILLALMFGITNTMLMSVMDRVREFGVLMAIGMQRKKVFFMIALETLLLSVTGAAIGAAFGFASVVWAGHTGINLAWFSDGLAQYGMSSMLFPVVHVSIYPSLGIMVIITACLAAIYPATKAIRLKPAIALASIG
jgi:putative ABC transport system permease protein